MFSTTIILLMNRIRSLSVVIKGTLIASLITTACCGDMDYIPKDWVDPTDMRFYDRETKSMKFSDSINQSHDSTSICTVPGATKNTMLIEENKRYQIFIERFINRILQSANLKDRILRPDSKIVTEIPVSITAEELSRLSAHGDNIQSSNLNDLDQLLSIIFSHERGFTFDALVSHLNPLQELFFSMSLERLTIIVGLTVAGVVIWMFVIRESMKRIMTFIFLMCLLSGMAFNGWNMYKEAIAEQFAEKKKLMHIPDVCNPKSNSWFSWFYFFRAKDECREFYRTMEVNPLSKVTMSVVFSHTISMMIIHPLKDLGAGVGDFLYGVSQAAPWPIKCFFLLFITVLFCTAVVFIIVIELGGSLKLWTLFGGLTITKEKTEKNEKLLSEFKKLEKYLKNTTQPIQAAAGDDNFKVDNQRSKSIASCDSKETEIHDHGEGSSQEIICKVPYNFPSLKYNPKTKSFIRRSMSQKLLINRKKYN